MRWMVCLYYLLVLCGCTQYSEQNNGFIQIKGSDTEVNVVQALAEKYMTTNDSLYIAVTGGGSGTGIAALINGSTSIANSSRALRPQEKDLCRQNSVRPTPIVFALDAIAIIANRASGINYLSTQQLHEVFTASDLNWERFNGNNHPITVYGRQSNSGTYVYMQREVLQADFNKSVRRMNGNAQIVEAIKNDPGGVGYVGIGYIDDLPADSPLVPVSLVVKNDTLSPLHRTTVNNGEYPLMRPLYQFTDSIPTGKVRAFIEYELSAKGQKIVTDNGFYPINQKFLEFNKESWGYEPK